LQLVIVGIGVAAFAIARISVDRRSLFLVLAAISIPAYFGSAPHRWHRHAQRNAAGRAVPG
jgi:hypothetical protein